MPHSPYRVESPGLETRAELVLDSVVERQPIEEVLVTGISGLAASLVIASAGFPVIAGGALAITGGIATWRWRHPPRPYAHSFVVERGTLTFSRGRATVARMRLVDLDDVALDTKTIRKVIAGNQPTPAVTHTNLSPELDLSRIVLKRGDGDEVEVTRYIAHYIALEWLGKTRSFLRENGWVPEDERG